MIITRHYLSTVYSRCPVLVVVPPNLEERGGERIKLEYK